MGIIVAYPPTIYADGTSLLVYQGQPNRSVNWTVTGSGTITPLSNYTDSAGLAGAKYTPGTPNTSVLVEVTAGA